MTGVQTCALPISLDGGASHGIAGVAIDEFTSQIIQAPLTSRAVVLGGRAGCQGDDFELFVGGKSSGGDRSEERLAGQRGDTRESDFARGSPFCGCNRVHWRLAHWRVDLGKRAARSNDTERPRLAAWNARVGGLPTVRVLRASRKSLEQMELA